MKQNLISARLNGIDLRFYTQPGLFSDDAVDPGTLLLLGALHVSPTARVLDIGCGYGVIGIVAAKLAERGEAVLVDCDIRATRMSQRNLELNHVTNATVVLGDGVHDLPPKERFHVVASNPPTHSGRDVLDDFVAGAFHLLRPHGQLYVVVNRLLSLRREIERVFGNEEVVARSKGYVVVRATKRPLRHEQDAFEGEA